MKTSNSADIQVLPAAALLHRKSRGYGWQTAQSEQREVSLSTLTKELYLAELRYPWPRRMADPQGAMKNFQRWIGTSIMVAVAAGLTSLLPKLHSQQIEATAAEAVSYEGQRVASVQLAGQPDGTPRRLRALIAQPINAPYSQAKVDETAAALVKAADVKDVDVQVTPAAEGLHVLFVLKPAYYFGVYTFPKAEKTFSYTRLLQLSLIHI